MRYPWILAAMASLLVASAVGGAEAQPDHASLSDSRLIYLLFIDRARDTGLEVEHAKADAAAAADALDRDIKVHKMNSSLYQRRALSTMDWERTRRQAEFSTANAIALKEKIIFLSASQRASKLQAKLLQGQWVDEKEVQKAYIQEWDSQCRYQRKAVHAAQAKLAFAEFDAKVARNLRERKVNSVEESLIKEHDFLEAKERLEAEKRADAGCLKDLPSFYIVPAQPTA